MNEPIEFDTEHLRLRQWRAADREPFAQLNADPRVMAYFPSPRDPQLCRERDRCRDLCLSLNATREDQKQERRRLLAELFEKETDAWIQPPFFCDYGTNIVLGANIFFNFNCVVLDVAAVTIGSNVLFGPALQICTATHPTQSSGAMRKNPGASRVYGSNKGG